MPEVTNEHAQDSEARRKADNLAGLSPMGDRREQLLTAHNPHPDHGVTLNASATDPVRHEALCLCGFASELHLDRRRAVMAGRHHLEAVSTIVDTAGDTDVSPAAACSYLDRVAASVARRIRERGVVLTVDELATVAVALDCSTTDLLPLHLSDPENLTDADRGLVWNDEAGTVTVRRLPWMNDGEWTQVRTEMAAQFEAAGLIRDEVAR